MDNRSATRARAFLRAQIRFNNGMSTMDCLIRDLSDGGARLEISDSVAIPASFDLYIPKRDETRRATVHWRTSEQLGVAFRDAADMRLEAPDMVERVARLEADIAALRQILDEMRSEVRSEQLRKAG